jgi:hypothetical protein
VLIGTRVVASIGVFDLDDLCAKIGERLRARWTGNDPREVHDEQTVESLRRGAVSWHANW